MSHSLAFTFIFFFGCMLAAGGEELTKASYENFQQTLRMQRYDADGDGKLSLAEQKLENAATDAAIAELGKRLLEKYDADQDGQLGKAEIKKAKSQYQRELLQRYDADKNGLLSKSEKRTAKKEYLIAGKLPDFSLDPRPC